MPPRKKTATDKPARPAHLSELCPECGTTEPHPTATHFACEHGSWELPPAVEPDMAEQDDEEFLDELQGADE